MEVKKHSRKFRVAMARKGWERFLKSKARRKKTYVPYLRVQKEESFKHKKSLLRLSLLKCPSVFTVKENTDDVVAFMEQVRNVKVEKYRRMKIDLADTTSIDNLAIMMLLSNISHASQRGIFVFGNSPNDYDARCFFDHSGFFSHVNCINKRDPAISSGDGLIVNLGKDIYCSKNANNVISGVIKRILGSKKLYQRLNGIVGEMGGNTIQYAYNDYKHYLFGAFPEGDKYSFVFADSGYGILSTLRRSLGQQMIDLIATSGPVDVLKGAFNHKYGSRTGEDNRNRGLPFIKKTFDDGFISNLMVISNNVLLNFAEPLNSRKLQSNYSGTVYFWQVGS